REPNTGSGARAGRWPGTVAAGPGSDVPDAACRRDRSRRTRRHRSRRCAADRTAGRGTRRELCPSWSCPTRFADDAVGGAAADGEADVLDADDLVLGAVEDLRE